MNTSGIYVEVAGIRNFSPLVVQQYDRRVYPNWVTAQFGYQKYKLFNQYPAVSELTVLTTCLCALKKKLMYYSCRFIFY